MAAFPSQNPACPLSTQDGPLIWLAQLSGLSCKSLSVSGLKPGSLRRAEPFLAAQIQPAEHMCTCVRECMRRAPARCPCA